MKSGVIATIDDAAILNTLKRLDPESAKALRKELLALGTEGKRRIVAGSPQGKTGRMRKSWRTKSSFTQSKAEVAITIKDWPAKVKSGGKEIKLARYPFILEHGRRAGESPRTGRVVTGMAPRPLIGPTRKALFIKSRETGERVRREALRILGS